MIEASTATWLRLSTVRNCGAASETSAPSTTMIATRLELALAGDVASQRAGRASAGRRRSRRRPVSHRPRPACRRRSAPSRRAGQVAGRREHHPLLGRLGRAAISAVIRPSWRTRIRSDIARTSGRSLEMRMIPRPGRGQLGDDPVDLDLGADVDAARRLVEDQHPRLRRQPLGEHDLLLVAARQRADQLVDAGHPDVELLACTRRRRSRSVGGVGRAAAGRAAAGSAGSRSGRSRSRAPGPPGGGPRAGRRSPASIAVGRAREARPACRRAGPRRRRARSIPNRTRATSVRPAPTRPAKPTISPARTEKLDVAERAGPGQPVDLEQDVADRRLDLREQRHGPADHVPDEVGGRELARRRS